MTVILTLLSLLWSGTKTFASAVWIFVSKPPGLYIACVVVLASGVWWWGDHQYQRGAADNEAAHAAAEAPAQQVIAIANIGLTADVNAVDTKALTDVAAGVQHLADLLTLQQSEIAHAFAASDIDARYPIPCLLVRAHDEGVLAVDSAAVESDACKADGAAAPTKASALSAAMLNDWNYTHNLEVLFAAAVADDIGVRKAWNDYRDKLIAAPPTAKQ